jgi:signal transduction histidine kinase
MPILESTHEDELRALMTMASHDLKSPLTSIQAHVEMLREDYAPDLGESFQQDLASIDRGLRRMGQLAQDLLDYARADHTLSPAPTSLREIAGDVIVEHVSPKAQVTVVGTLPTVVADAALLRHVLDNLVGNAIKYSPAGVTARVEIRAHSRADGATRIEVADRGIGIPAADRPKVFDAFHRCANRDGRPGTGLGLAICRRIVERHGGRIGVTDNPGGGSRFWFTLPQSPA